MPMNPRLLRPIATGFNPKSLPGLKVWYDVANTGSMTFNGSTVSQINDLSGNGFHATQGTANNQPTYSATAANGKPRLTFDTTDSLLSSATVADYVLNPTSGPVVTFVLACYKPPKASQGDINLGSDSQANGRVYISTDFGTAGALIFDVATIPGGRLGGSYSEISDTPHIVTFLRHTSTMKFRVDGATLLSKANASGNFSATTAGLSISKIDGAGGSIMYVSEVLVYAAALNDVQLATAERGLGKKWGITVA
jgi:hypothetical protein